MRGLTLNIDHRHRRLRRNARDIAPNKFVQHYIAEYDDVAIAQLPKDGFSPLPKGIREGFQTHKLACSYSPIIFWIRLVEMLLCSSLEWIVLKTISVGVCDY